ncbi:MAG: hypothetical protein ABI679_15590 [Gemmatimonadota bacterium]
MTAGISAAFILFFSSPALPTDIRAEASAPESAIVADTDAVDGSHDFDFLVGTWNVTNRRLKQRWVGSTEWDEFPCVSVSTPLLDGTGNLEQMSFPTRGFSGISLSLFDQAKKEWSQYWVSSREGIMTPPGVGRFHNGRGEFYADDTDDGKPIKVMMVWSDITESSIHWEQAFSADGGKTWETNWTMSFSRVTPALGASKP